MRLHRAVIGTLLPLALLAVLGLTTSAVAAGPGATAAKKKKKKFAPKYGLYTNNAGTVRLRVLKTPQATYVRLFKTPQMTVPCTNGPSRPFAVGGLGVSALLKKKSFSLDLSHGSVEVKGHFTSTKALTGTYRPEFQPAPGLTCTIPAVKFSATYKSS